MITGVLPLRNAIKLDYPWELALGSLAASCDEVLVGVDPSSEDDTLARVSASLPPHGRIVESVWDLDNHGGHQGQSEIAKQTQILFDAATYEWIFSLQADEMLHERDHDWLRAAVDHALREGAPQRAWTFRRLYFYGGLDTLRLGWTQEILRLANRGWWKPDPFSGGMTFVHTQPDAAYYPPAPSGRGSEDAVRRGPPMYHYSRVGDPQTVALRVRNLDTFYHDPANVLTTSEVPAYDFKEVRELDTYVRGTRPEHDKKADLVPFSVGMHPAMARARWGR